jgi:hypothetical protein
MVSLQVYPQKMWINRRCREIEWIFVSKITANLL